MQIKACAAKKWLLLNLRKSSSKMSPFLQDKRRRRGRMSCIYPASTTREMNSWPTVSVISCAHSQNGQCRMRMNNLTRNTFGAARLSLVHYAAFKIKCLPFFQSSCSISPGTVKVVNIPAGRTAPALLIIRPCDDSTALMCCGQYVAVLIRALMHTHVCGCVPLCTQGYVHNYRGHGPSLGK